MNPQEHHPLLQESTPEMFELIGAETEMKKTVQRYLTINMVVSIVVVVLFGFIASIFKGFAAYAALFSILVFVLDNLFITPKIKSMKESAAKVREIFDTKVLGMEWNEYKLGHANEHEQIALYSRKFGNPNFDYREYPIELASLPIEYTRAICQRENVWWNKYLIRLYSDALIITMLISFILLFLFGLVSHATLEQFILLAIMPMVPIFNFCIKQLQENSHSISALGELNKSAEELWIKTINEKYDAIELGVLSRQLQDAIFDTRSKGVILPDWFEDRFDTRSAAKQTTMSLLAEAEAVLAKGKPRLGVQFGQVGDRQRQSLKLKYGFGVTVENVDFKLNDSKDSLKVGDVVTAINGEIVCREKRVHAILRSLGEPKKISVELYRGKRLMNVRVPLLRPTEDAAKNSQDSRAL